MVLNLRSENTYKAIMSSSRTVIHGCTSATSPRQPWSWQMGLQPASFPPRGGWANPIQPCQRPSRCLLMNSGKKTTYCAPGDLLVILLGDLSCNPRVSWLSPEPGVLCTQTAPSRSLSQDTAKTPWKVAPTPPWSFCDSTDVYAQALLYRGWESNQNLARWLMD